MSSPVHREHVGPLFAGIATVIALVSTVLGSEPDGPWLLGLSIIASHGMTVVAIATAASWHGTRGTAMSYAASLLTVGGAFLTLAVSFTSILWAREMERESVVLIFNILNLMTFGGLVLAFVSMALETKVLAADPTRFVAFAGAAGAGLQALAPLLELRGGMYTYLFYGTCAAALLTFAFKAKMVAKELPPASPQMDGWSEAMAGGEQFKTALTWLILAGFIVNFITNKMQDRDTLMMTLLGALLVNAGILAMAARGAARFRAIPQLTEARGPAHAAAAFALMAAALSATTLILGVVGIARVVKGVSFIDVIQHLAPSIEAIQSLMWITAVLSLMAALSALGRSMNAPTLKRAARVGMVLFGLGALATLTAKGVLLKRGGFDGKAGTMAIVGLVGVVVLIAGLVYVFKALGEASEHLAGAEGEQIANALD